MISFDSLSCRSKKIIISGASTLMGGPRFANCGSLSIYACGPCKTIEQVPFPSSVVSCLRVTTSPASKRYGETIIDWSWTSYERESSRENKRPGRTDEYRVEPSSEWVPYKNLVEIRKRLKKEPLPQDTTQDPEVMAE